MATLVVFGDAADGSVRCDSLTYADARSGAGSFVVSTTANPDNLGVLNFGGTYLYVDLYLGFDTSAIPDTDPVSAAVLSLYASSANGAGPFPGVIGEARIYDWGATVTSADFVPGDSLATLTLVATQDGATFSPGSYNDWVSDAAMPANVSKTGFTRMVLANDIQRTNGAAPAFNQGNLLTYQTSNAAGTTQDPKLTITHGSTSSFHKESLLLGWVG